MEMLNALNATVERLASAVDALEASAMSYGERLNRPMSGEVAKMTAAVEAPTDGAIEREQELRRRLALAEQEIAQLMAQAAHQTAKSKEVEAVRKTLPPATVQLLAKQGVEAMGAMELSSVDSALTGLSIEQRIAVKAQLIRAGAFLS